MSAVARYDNLLPSFRLPGCQNGEILNQLREAGHEFFRRSECWQHTIPSINIVANQKAYTLTPSYHAQIRRIVEVRFNTAAGVAAGDEGTAQDLTVIEFTPPNTLTLDSKPTEAVTSGLEVDVKLCPYKYGNELPEELLDLYADAIICGALAKLYDYPENCPWADPRKAQENTSKFNQAIVQASVDSDKGHRNVDLKMGTQDFLV